MIEAVNKGVFPRLIESLLKGDVICEFTDELAYRYLEEPRHIQEVDSYLRRIGRVLKSTQDQSAYYCGYYEINNPAARVQVKRQFNEAMNDMEPLVRWLRLASAAQSNSAPLRPGDTLRGSELLEAIESAPALTQELERLSRTRMFSNASTGAKKQLDAILKKLLDNKYLVSRGTSGSVFVATGKWGRLYEVLQFIASHERLDSDEDEPEQTELLS